MNNFPQLSIPSAAKDSFGGTGGSRAVADLQSLIQQLGPDNDFAPSLAMAVEVMQERMDENARSGKDGR